MSALLPLLLAAAASCPPAPAPTNVDSLEALYRGGLPFDVFLEAAEARRELWLKNVDRAVVSPGLLERAQRAAGDWKLLVVAVDGCSDSVSTIPYIAKLVDGVPNLELRIVHPDDGRAIMESHRTPDDRAATPTIVLLDASFAERGCWVERPSELRGWWRDNDALDTDARVDGKMAWYEEDLGRSTVREIVEMIEAAAAGDLRCG